MWRCFCFHSPSLLSWGALFPPTAFERITAVSLVARESAHPQIHTHTRAHRRTSGGKCKSPSSCFTVTFHQSGSFPFFCKPRFISKYYEALSEPTPGNRALEELGRTGKGDLVSETFTGLCESDRTQLLCTSGGLVMTSKRKLARLNLRRSLSEQLRSSTSKAWDLLWKNVKERRLAGQ